MSMRPQDHDFAALQTRLRIRARRLGAQTGDAEDMAQETLLRLIQRMARMDVQAPERYAMIILHNLARSRWRMQVETKELEDNDASTLPAADSRLALASLTRAISTLPPEQAQIMQLLLQGEVSPRAIAVQLGLPKGTVMSRLARARAKLRADVGLEEGMPVSELI